MHICWILDPVAANWRCEQDMFEWIALSKSNSSKLSFLEGIIKEEGS